MRTRFGSVAGLTCLVLGGLGACGETQTELLVRVYSDVPCDATVAVAAGPVGEVGDRDPSAVSTVCDPNDGSRGVLVVVPKRKASEFSVEARVRADQGDPATCRAQNKYEGCIVTRRIVNYIPGRTVELRLDLRNPCLNTPCSEATTCIAQGTSKSCLEARIDVRKCSGVCGDEAVVEQSTTSVDACFHNPCGEGAMCKVSEGVTVCTCPDGFKHSAVAPLSCEDIDECALGTHNCQSAADCTNTEGSFSCGCPAGFTKAGSACIDIDECALGTHNCQSAADCTNTEGSFACGCPAGFETAESGCADIDECALEIDDCDSLVTCENLAGGFRCGACPTGYRDVLGNGTQCDDIDECAEDSDNCAANVACNNSPGAYLCGTCPSGYIDVNGDGTLCEDIDECATNADKCDARVTCTNTSGGFECGKCPAGFTGDGTSCTDLDECKNNSDNCDPLVSCTNKLGGFTCGACPSGYTDVNGNGTSCQDKDECAANTDNCHSNATCSNKPGSFACQCTAGYSDVNGDGTLCQCLSSVPIMSSATAPLGIVTSSGDLNGTYPGFQAFDASDASMWISKQDVSPAWLAYEFADGAKTIKRYVIRYSNGSILSRAPKAWTLEGWNGSSWVALDTRTNQTNWNGTAVRREFDVATPGAYTRYRLNISDDNDPNQGTPVHVISIGKLELYGCN